MKEINQPVPESDIFNDLEEAVAFANRIGYPIIIRPAYIGRVLVVVLRIMKMKCMKSHAVV